MKVNMWSDYCWQSFFIVAASSFHDKFKCFKDFHLSHTSFKLTDIEIVAKHSKDAPSDYYYDF